MTPWRFCGVLTCGTSGSTPPNGRGGHDDCHHAVAHGRGVDRRSGDGASHGQRNYHHCRGDAADCHGPAVRPDHSASGGRGTMNETAEQVIDRALAEVNGRSLIPASDVTNWLLDIRPAVAARPTDEEIAALIEEESVEECVGRHGGAALPRGEHAPLHPGLP